MNKIILILGVIFAAILAWFIFSKSSTPQSDIISSNGLHWHAELSINILGKDQEIPAGIGLEKLPHNPLHTHDRDSVIHMEFEGKVAADDIRLGRFFQIWGKQFNNDCIFDKCSGPEGRLKMLVNNSENNEFENYAMKDGDKIEIIFEALPDAASALKEITVIGREFSFSPSAINIKAGERVKIIFKNLGGASHNLVIDGLGISTKTISGPGKTDTVEFTAPTSGTYAFFCSIPGHRRAGMEGKIIVE